MSEDLHAAAEYGAQVQAFLDSPLWDDAYEGLKASYMNEFFATDPEDEEGRREIYKRMNVLLDVLSLLRGFVTNGEGAQAELESLAQHMKFPRDVPVAFDENGNPLRAN